MRSVIVVLKWKGNDDDRRGCVWLQFSTKGLSLSPAKSKMIDFSIPSEWQ